MTTAFMNKSKLIRDKIRQADGILFASPEYNYSVSGPLKNAIDWGSRPPNVWADKAAALVSAAGGSGGNRQQYHIRQIGVFLDLHFINKPEFFLRRPLAPPQKCDRDGNLIDEVIREKLKEVHLSLLPFGKFAKFLQNASEIANQNSILGWL
ncbi:NADPH:quinone oxidoreductase-like [Coffea arabica]|uniref:NAD(P)H dehydrogenase (quinone) n=1 Tax=Coffea arabica TaxID=13443 RepID=A0A6P6W2H9_COFAR|nr:NADPH:quinone oxidoreductase-like [Coffea arabica]